MNLSSLSNNPIEIVVGDRTRRFYVGTVRQLGRLQEWLDTIPPPKKGGMQIAPDMPPQLVRMLAAQQADSSKDWPPDITSQEGMRVLNRNDKGKALLLKLSLQHGEPSITDADADGMLDLLTYEEYNRIAMKFFGFAEEIGPGPKGEAEQAQATTNGTTGEPVPVVAESTTSTSPATS